MEYTLYEIVKLRLHIFLNYLGIGYGSPNAFYDILLCVNMEQLDFILILDFVFIVKLFPHMLVISDKIGGRRSLILVA